MSIAPGATDTRPEWMAAVREWQLAHTPPARIGRTEEVAWAIAQLAAPAASFVSGVVLPVDVTGPTPRVPRVSRPIRQSAVQGSEHRERAVNTLCQF
jgi:hypothetical protein